MSVTITQKEARFLALYSQGLLKTVKQTVDVLDQLSYIQIDTISVTERAHNHVLFTRNSKFKATAFDKMMEDKSIFEYWSHAAAYLPIKDYHFSLFQKEAYRDGKKHWFPRNQKVEQYVMDRIKAEGPLQSKDFEKWEKTGNGWGQWKPAKMAMSNLFMDGEIMIAHRKGFQKVFDLTERVVPSGIITVTPTIDVYGNHLIDNAIKAHGIVTLNEIVYLRKGIKITIKKLLDERVNANDIVSLKVENNENEYYSTPATLDLLNQSKSRKKQLHILNVFDNLIIQRKRVKDLFGFEYQMECYVPEKKRVFGYYTLPVLWGDTLVARFDAKADRKTKTFHVKGFWFEKDFKPTDHFFQFFNKQLEVFAQFCGCERIDNSFL